MTVKIITDSVADLPREIVEELGITVIPIHVCFGTEVYRDGIDLTVDQFYRKMSESKVMPTTAVPPPADLVEIYEKVAETADEIVVITLSSRLSGLHEAAVKSVELVKKKCRIEVIDSQWAIMAQGFVAMAAARAAKAGASFDEVMEAARRTIPRVYLCSAFDTLEYLKRGGRVGKAAAFMGSMLHVNPIIGMKDGIVVPFARERSRAKAIDYLVNSASRFSRIEEISVACVNAVDDAEMLIERLSPMFPKERVIRSRTSPVIGTHTGPNLLVLALQGDR